MSSSRKPFWVYSAGAVAPPLQAAVDLFEKTTGVEYRLTAGRPEALLKSVAMNHKGDVISTGAEYILDEAEDRGLVLRGSRRTLGVRRSAIIVPSGNPARITSLENLCRDGVRIGIAVDGCLKGVWDDVASKAGLTGRIRANIVEHADACGSLMSLVHMGQVDAVFGWNAFKNLWPETCDAVDLPRDLQVFRSTCVGILTCTRDGDLSRRFLDFLNTAEVRAIYEEMGWLHGVP
jgi:accessory colonization factor AcfC